MTSSESESRRFHGDDVCREVVHEEDTPVSVHIQLVDEAEPVDNEAGTKPVTAVTARGVRGLDTEG